MDLDSLNSAQRQAVTAGGGAHLVVAGAGTGKTRTLVHRVAWLLEQGVPPAEIVLLTFTRRAAEEMLDRVAALVGAAARGVRGGTFHAFANTALRRHAPLLGYTRAFTILDSGDAESLVGLARTELGFGGKGARFAQRGTILAVLSRSVNTGRPIEAVLEEDYPQYAREAEAFGRIRERYAARKKASDAMDFDDLLVELVRLLRDHEEARRRLSGGIRHLLVDEYQDTNRLQAQIAGLLSVVHGNLMVVGDEAQSIYGFRGAVVENILEFPRLHPGASVTLLEQNYRSVQPILDLANAVLDSARQGYDKRLRSDVPGDELPVLVQVEDEHEQADTVVRQIVALAEAGVGVERQAVLFRSANHANLLEVALAEAGVPYRKFGGIRFTEAAHIKDLMALLRLVANPRDALAWLRVLQWFEGLGEQTAQRIGDAVVAREQPRLEAGAFRGRKYHADLVALAALLEEAGRLSPDLPALVERVSSWYRERLERLYDDASKRTSDLEVFGLLAERYGTLEELLAQLALDPVEGKAEEGVLEEGFLTLSTVHSAKGLEYDVVYVLQLADGAFPSGWALEDMDGVEEERRLFYVAVTRARRHLYLMRPRYVRQRTGTMFAPTCMFLDELEQLDDLVVAARPGAPGWQAGFGDAHREEDARLARLLSWYDEG